MAPRSLPDLLAELAILTARVQAELARQPTEAPSMPATSTSASLEYLDEAGVAAWIGVSRETLKAMRRGTEGPPFVRVARRAVRYEVAAVREWLRHRTVGHPRRADQVATARRAAGRSA